MAALEERNNLNITRTGESSSSSEVVQFGLKYDAFISYSHSADRDLARCVEKTLWTFGRKWYQLRGVRTYRDETNLAAEPDLWPAIQNAIQLSRCLALCASPDSARSKWVPREVESFVKEKGVHGLCIVQTSGVLPWTDHLSAEEMLEREDGALSEAVWRLFEVSGIVPLVVDLRTFRSIPEQRRLKDPEYLSRVAALAAKALGKDKETIWGEYHRAQRVRTTFLSAASFLLLSLVVGLEVELRAARRASLREAEQRQIAQRETAESQRQRGNAEKNAGEARINELNALRNAHESKARELAVYSSEIRREDPEQSILLGMYAVQETLDAGAPVAEAEEALHASLQVSHLRLTLRGHAGPVKGLVFSPDNRFLATISTDKTAKIWDALKGKELITFKGSFTSIGFDSKRIVTTGTDNTLTVWDAANSQQLRKIAGPFAMVASNSRGRFLATISKPNTVQIWDSATGQEMQHLLGPFTSVAEAPPVFKPVFAYNDDGVAKIWGKEFYTPENMPTPNISIALSPDSSRVASANGDAVTVWDVETGTRQQSERGPFTSVAFGTDGLFAAADGESVKLWSLGTDQELKTLIGHSGPITSISFSPRSGSLATSSLDGTAKIWTVSSGREDFTLRGHAGAVYGVTFSPNGHWIATGGEDGTAKIWDVQSGEQLLTVENSDNSILDGFAISRDASRIVTVGRSSIDVWGCEWPQASLLAKRTPDSDERRHCVQPGWESHFGGELERCSFFGRSQRQGITRHGLGWPVDTPVPQSRR